MKNSSKKTLLPIKKKLTDSGAKKRKEEKQRDKNNKKLRTRQNQPKLSQKHFFLKDFDCIFYFTNLAEYY